MVLTDKSGTQWGLHFYHTTDRPIGKSPQRTCVATLHHGRCATKNRPCETPGAVVGAATCYFRDTYSAMVGRRVALTRAMAQLVPLREARADLWDCYLKKIGLRKPSCLDPQ